MDNGVPAVVRRELLTPLGIESVTPVRPGMSGALVYQCLDARGDRWALRRWPLETPPERVAEIHQVLDVARSNGCRLVPRAANESPHPQPIAGEEGTWELAEWMPGEPATSEANDERIRAGASAIAQFHLAVRPLGVRLGPAPAVVSRLHRLETLNRLLPSTLRETAYTNPSGELKERVQTAIRLLQANWSEVSTRIARSMTRYVSSAVPLQYVLRDVHRQHVLFERQVVSGLIDFDAIRVDTPMTDLARWIGSFDRGVTESAWSEGLAGYHEHSPSFQEGTESRSGFEPRTMSVGEQRAFAAELGYATNWISLANWAIWLVRQKRTFPGGPTSVAGRIAELVRFCDPESLGNLRQH